jgi:uncharacterized protein (DUF1697 family)
MTAMICMLRGVNVGGHNKIKMDALRILFASLGLENPRTLIQSGNIIFGSRQKDETALARRIGAAIEKTFGIRAEVILRTAAEMADVIARNPFAGRAGIEPNRLVVTFLAGNPDPETGGRISKLPTTPEELHFSGRELYVYFPNGISGSKLPAAAIDKALKIPGTARNWNTVCKLLELASPAA